MKKLIAIIGLLVISFFIGQKSNASSVLWKSQETRNSGWTMAVGDSFCETFYTGTQCTLDKISIMNDVQGAISVTIKIYKGENSTSTPIYTQNFTPPGTSGWAWRDYDLTGYLNLENNTWYNVCIVRNSGGTGISTGFNTTGSLDGSTNWRFNIGTSWYTTYDMTSRFYIENSATCAVCGNLTVETGEECDQSLCCTNCSWTHNCCGNTLIESANNENCDDGNLNKYDGCGQFCTQETTKIVNFLSASNTLFTTTLTNTGNVFNGFAGFLKLFIGLLIALIIIIGFVRIVGL